MDYFFSESSNIQKARNLDHLHLHKQQMYKQPIDTELSLYLEMQELIIQPILKEHKESGKYIEDVIEGRD